MQFTLETIEAALDSGKLEAAMQSGRWWRLRRNGRTQKWKTRPSDFRIPVKCGLRSCAAIDHYNLNSGNWRIAPEGK